MLVIILNLAVYLLPLLVWLLWRQVKKKYPGQMVKFSKVFSFFAMIVLFGVMMSEMGMWCLVPPLILVLGLPLWYMYYINVQKNKFWTGAYVVFCLCSFVWVLELSGWTDSGGATSGAGVWFFVLGACIMSLLGMIFQKHPFSGLIAIIVAVACVVLTLDEPDLVVRLRCSPDKPLFSRGKCYACDDIKVFSTNETRCSVCGSMRRMHNEQLCVLTQCPPSHPLRNAYQECMEVCPADKPVRNYERGECYRCDYLGVIRQTDADSCNKCGALRIMSPEGCILAQCPTDKPLRLYGQCVSCDEPTAIKKIEATQCAQCNNRAMKDGVCALKECPTAYPLRGNTGTCHACNEQDAFDTTAEQCLACAQTHVYIAAEHQCVHKQTAAYRARLRQKRLGR